MGLFDTLKTNVEYTNKLHGDLYECNICGMRSKDQQAMRTHITEFHTEYMTYRPQSGNMPEIATSTWINIYYRILFAPPKDWTNKQLEMHVGITRTSIIPNIIASINRVLVDGKVAGYINPTMGKTTLWTNYNISKALKQGKVRQYTFHRVFTCKGTLLKKKPSTAEFLIRFREGGRESLLLEDRATHGREILKTEKLTYGYSPLDFIPDRPLFVELDNALNINFNIRSDFATPTIVVFFNKDEEPCIQARLGSTLYLEHRIIDRIELKNKAPKIEEACFRDKGLDDLIEFERNYIKINGKNTRTKSIEKWISAVDKLM